jgi:hypothetical protein
MATHTRSGRLRRLDARHALVALAAACIMAIPPGGSLPVDNGSAPSALLVPPSCPQGTLATTITQGDADGFDGSNGGDAATPRVGLTHWIKAVSTEPLRGYDDDSVNKQFGTTLVNLPPNIVEGTLYIHVRAVGDLWQNDGWKAGFDDLSNTWSAGGTTGTQTVHFDVLNNINPALGKEVNEGFLDVYVQDDTDVDYIQLDLTYCPCEQWISDSQTQGDEDTFDPTNQPPGTPRAPGYTAWLAGLSEPTRKYDEPGVNKVFGTSFSSLPKHLTSLSATFHVRGEGERDWNDAVSLAFHPQLKLVNSVPPALPKFSWGASITPNLMTIQVDMLDGGLVLADVNDDHALDVFIQDDTNIDWIRIDYTYCECGGPLPSVDAATLADAASACLAAAESTTLCASPDLSPCPPACPDDPGALDPPATATEADGTACGVNAQTYTVVTPTGTYYYENRDDGFWVYLETNGQPGLQRGRSSVVLGDNDPESCSDGGDLSDTLVA